MKCSPLADSPLPNSRGSCKKLSRPPRTAFSFRRSAKRKNDRVKIIIAIIIIALGLLVWQQHKQIGELTEKLDAAEKTAAEADSLRQDNQRLKQQLQQQHASPTPSLLDRRGGR